MGPCNAGGGVALAALSKLGEAVGEELTLKIPLLPFVKGPFCNRVC